MDDLSVFFLAECEQSADDVMARLTTFIRAAKQTLAFAIYDMRFSDPLRAQLAAALRERAEAGRERNLACHVTSSVETPGVAGVRGAPVEARM